MACKNCDELRAEAKHLSERLVGVRQALETERTKGEELQEACKSRYDEVGTLRMSLQKELEKLSVHDLMRIASTSVQLAGLHQKDFPGGSPVTDEASSVALGALKQVRERLQEGA